MNIEELRKLLKKNGVHFYTYWSKQKLKELVEINDLLPKKKNRRRKNRST